MPLSSIPADTCAAIKVVPRAIALNLLVAGLYSSALAAGASPPCKLAVLGDSLSAGFGVAAGAAFPQQVQAGLLQAGLDCTVLNAGVSGDTSAGGLARLDWVLADEPTHLIVELGGNDGLRALPPEELERNLAAIVGSAQKAGVKVYLMGMVAPPNLGHDYTSEFEQAYKSVSAEYDVPLYPFFLDGIITDESLMQADGIHPNAEGVRRLTERILPGVTRWLNETGAVHR